MSLATRRRPSFRLERLEQRDVPSAALPWADAQHLTVSFVPDGTTLGTRTSDLFQSLQQQQISTSEWQGAILRAFQAWAVNANVNFGLVAEQGQTPLGASGGSKGKVGDIRIAGMPLSDDQLALTTLPGAGAGGLAGDIIINTSHNFGKGQGQKFDLFLVMLHEVGHALGVGHSDDAKSVMNETYGAATGLSAGDVQAVQSLYGPRAADKFEGRSGNDTLATATALEPKKLVEADLTTAGDVDVYHFKNSGGATKLATVSLQTAGLSLLAAKLEVLDAAGRVVASTAAGNAQGGDLSVQFQAAAGATYYARVSAADGGSFGVGSYRIGATFSKIAVSGPVISALNQSQGDGSVDGDEDRFNQVVAFSDAPTMAAKRDLLTLQTASSQVFQLDLSASDSRAAGKVKVFDAAGQQVAALNVRGSSQVTVLLDPGTYTFRFEAGGDSSARPAGVTYTLSMKVLSDPIDAYPVGGATGTPSGGTSGGSSGSSTTTVVKLLEPTSSTWWPGW